MKFVDTKPPVSDVDLDGVEIALGFPLPEDLRKHYLHFNGGRPVPNLFRKSGEVFSVQEFLPIKYGMHGERFEDTYKELVVGNDFFPGELIPIASDAGGDYFCYSMRDGEKGAILFYQSDYYDDPARAIVPLCESLKEFLDSLVSDG